MIRGEPAIDADAHVYEDPFLLTKRAPVDVREQLPREYGRALGYRFGDQIAHSSRARWVAFEEGSWPALRDHLEQTERGGSHVVSARVVDELYPGVAQLADGTPWEQRYPELPEHYGDSWYSAEATVATLTKQGFDHAFLYPSLGLFLPCFDGMGALGIAACRVYNDWLVEYCGLYPRILHPVALVSLHVVSLAVEEIRRMRALGCTAVCLARFPDGRTSADADIEPFWAACEDAGMLVAFHPVTTSIYLRNPPPQRPSTPFHLFNCNMFAEHFANLWIAGVLERHPNLRIALLESGCGWLPSVLWRLERSFWRPLTERGTWAEELPWLLSGFTRDELAENVRMPPVEYFRRQCYVACEAEPFVTSVADYIGADRIVFQGDFPHPDHHPAFVEEFVAMVPPALRKKILWDNPATMYWGGVD